MKKWFAAATCCMALPLAAAPVYTCRNGTETVYTSEPLGHCREDKLPGISRYEGAAASLKPAAKRKPKAVQKTPQRSSKASSRKTSAQTGAKQAGQKRIKGQGNKGFPAVAGKEVQAR
ncbi:hypothetical protein LVJ83_06390 [Uruburuella testudinis]|uniref:DUF4124 domain-containing protein n=1 Tax=Uruburuella testudinis TaxID=1282863 RepID=A0ABY4DWL1_9NEIS|nr:hypothetical protein [Uruburuella testudinis]UOO83084.1 hypothetical protein LVJ83_06390 [Uruburuella testudinis]